MCEESSPIFESIFRYSRHKDDMFGTCLSCFGVLVGQPLFKRIIVHSGKLVGQMTPPPTNIR